jgi:hypothetical protein
MGLSCGLNELASSFGQFDFLLEGIEEDDGYMIRQKTGSSLRRSTEAFEQRILQEEAVEKKPRCFLYVPWCQCRAGHDAGGFFKEAKLRGITLDVESSLGTAFLLLDSLQSGAVGLLLCRESWQALGLELGRVARWLGEQRGRPFEEGLAVGLRELGQAARKLAHIEG